MNERSLFLHADGDSFFAACELTLRPELRGKPVVVGEDRGIAAAMSYEAKKLGIHRAMPIFQIRKLYPEVVILDHHFHLYRDISDRMHEIVHSYLDMVERYSIDECFALVTNADIAYFGKGDPVKAVRAIKDEVQSATKVTYSFGLARTKALAKIASKLKKPDGLVALLTKEDENRALQATPISDVWGIGRRTVPRFENLGMKTAYDFAHYDSRIIERYFSEPVLDLQRELRGEPVLSVEGESDPRDQKSLQSTGTFRPASADQKVIWSELAENVEHACKRARKLGLVSAHVSFFAKSSDFTYRTGETKLPLYTADPGLILNVIEPLLPRILLPGERIRATGITLHGLRREEDVEYDLFGVQENATGRLVVERAADALRKKYGPDIVRRASSLKADIREDVDSFHPRAKI